MADYLILYEGGDGNWQNRPAEEVQKAMEQWGAWFKRLEADGVLRNPGAALSRGGAVVKRNGTGFVTDTNMAEVKELIGGFTVIAAPSLEQAAKIAEGSPFLGNNPQGRIRVQPVYEPKA
jgi:hypothetical protein